MRAGPDEAFEELVRLHGGALLATVRRFLPDEREAREALTRAFRSALDRIHECASDDRLADWLRGIAVDVCIERMASLPDRAAVDELLPRFNGAGEHTSPIMAWPERRGADPERCAEARRHIEVLPPSYRLVVVLAHGEELTASEIAARLALPLGEVKERLHRARQALITLLGPTLAPRVAG